MQRQYGRIMHPPRHRDATAVRAGGNGSTGGLCTHPAIGGNGGTGGLCTHPAIGGNGGTGGLCTRPAIGGNDGTGGMQRQYGRIMHPPRHREATAVRAGGNGGTGGFKTRPYSLLAEDHELPRPQRSRSAQRDYRLSAIGYRLSPIPYRHRLHSSSMMWYDTNIHDAVRLNVWL